MWISARTATTLAAAALLLVMVAVAAPLIPRPNLPSLPEERPTPAATTKTAPPVVADKSEASKPSADKFGEATAVLAAPERVRAQRMETGVPALLGAARWAARVGTGPAATPSDESVKRLLTLLRDARTVADPRAAKAEPAWVVRLVRDERKVDVMVDPAHDRLVVSLDGKVVGTFGAAALHREFSGLGEVLFP